MNNYVKILWICIIIMVILIAGRLLQRYTQPARFNNVKEVLINQSLPALDETKKEIFGDQNESQLTEY